MEEEDLIREAFNQFKGRESNQKLYHGFKCGWKACKEEYKREDPSEVFVVMNLYERKVDCIWGLYTSLEKAEQAAKELMELNKLEKLTKIVKTHLIL